MKPRIIITRALPEAETTAALVVEAGAIGVLAPLLTIEPRHCDTRLDGVQAIIFTSANGVRAFSSQAPARAFCVGPATASAARAAGFEVVGVTHGGAVALTEAVCAACDPKRGKLLHVSGADIAFDVAGALSRRGFEAERRVAYEACAAPAPPAGLLAPADAILFHSARAARVFLAFGAPGAAHLRAVCISPAVAEVIAGLSWTDLALAATPTDGALIAAAVAPTDANA